MVNLEVRNNYYSNIGVLFEIVKNLIGREAVFLSKNEYWRCLKIHKMEFFNKHAQRWSFWRKPFNIYYSLAKLYNMPMVSFNPKIRKDQLTEFGKNFNQYMVGFDLGVDFDSKELGLEKVYKDTKKLKGIFDDYNIAYELKCSGRGFHININHDKMPDIRDKPDFFKRMVEKIKLIFNLPTLDLGIYDERRIWKAPYSYDVKSGNIALPLDNYQFDNFEWDMVKPEEVLKLNIRNRGNLERAGKKENFTHFLNDYIIDKVLAID